MPADVLGGGPPRAAAPTSVVAVPFLEAVRVFVGAHLLFHLIS
jgi:hypothetical protein